MDIFFKFIYRFKLFAETSDLTTTVTSSSGESPPKKWNSEVKGYAEYEMFLVNISTRERLVSSTRRTDRNQ